MNNMYGPSQQVPGQLWGDYQNYYNNMQNNPYAQQQQQGANQYAQQGGAFAGYLNDMAGGLSQAGQQNYQNQQGYQSGLMSALQGSLGGGQGYTSQLRAWPAARPTSACPDLIAARPMAPIPSSARTTAAASDPSRATPAMAAARRNRCRAAAVLRRAAAARLRRASTRAPQGTGLRSPPAARGRSRLLPLAATSLRRRSRPGRRRAVSLRATRGWVRAGAWAPSIPSYAAGRRPDDDQPRPDDGRWPDATDAGRRRSDECQPCLFVSAAQRYDREHVANGRSAAAGSSRRVVRSLGADLRLYAVERHRAAAGEFTGAGNSLYGYQQGLAVSCRTRCSRLMVWAWASPARCRV